MFTTNVFIAALTLCTLLVAIGCDRMDDQVIDKIDEAGDDIGNTGTVVFGFTAETEWGTDEYVINAATVEDDTLRVNVSYSGGCETHAFTLVAEPMFLESFPVQLRVSIAHNANGDTCEACDHGGPRFRPHTYQRSLSERLPDGYRHDRFTP